MKKLWMTLTLRQWSEQGTMQRAYINMHWIHIKKLDTYTSLKYMTTTMDVAAGSTRPPVRLLLLLTLSPAAASKVIAKHKKRVRLQAADGGVFECRTCGRRFATFQALGGHRTSHKWPRVRAHGLDLLLGARPGKGVQHRCGTCGQVFATGEALGGHMRRHRSVGCTMPTATRTEAATWSSGLSDQHDDGENDACPTLIQFI